MRSAALLKAYAALLLGLAAAPLSLSHAAVWKAKNTWSAEWEQKYSSWAETITPTIFTDPNSPYAGIATDCADLAYLVRIFFSAENSLPFAMTDPTTGRGRLTNDTAKFDGVADPKARLRAFLNYVQLHAGTKNLPSDTYRVALNREGVRPGAIVLHKSHAQLITRISRDGTVKILSSTVPRKVRNLAISLGTSYLFEGNTEIRYFRQPQYIGVAEDQVPGFSMSQFVGRRQISVGPGVTKEIGETSPEQVRQALSLSTEPSSVMTEFVRVKQNVCSQIHARMSAVNDGIEHSRAIGGRCFDAREYDDYSTPTRDRRLYADLEEMAQLYQQVVSRKMLGVPDMLELQEYSQKLCPVEIAGKKVSLRELMRRFQRGKISSNPNDSLEARWGEVALTPSQCPVY